MVEAEAELAREVAEWLARAQREDAAEDAEHGSTRRGDEPPDWMRDKQARLARIRAAKRELEAEARQAEAAMAPPPCDPDGSPRPRPGRPPRHPPGQPKSKSLLRDNLDERRVASFADVPGRIEFCLNELLPLPHQALPLPHGALPLPHQPASAGRLSRRTPSPGLAPGANP